MTVWASSTTNNPISLSPINDWISPLLTSVSIDTYNISIFPSLISLAIVAFSVGEIPELIVFALLISSLFKFSTWSFINPISGDITIVNFLFSGSLCFIYREGNWNIIDFPAPVDEVINISLGVFLLLAIFICSTISSIIWAWLIFDISLVWISS